MSPRFESSPPQSVCLLRLSAIGDTCHAAAALDALQRAWPDTRFTWIIGRLEARLMTAILPRVEFITFDKIATAARLLRRHQRLDLARLLQGFRAGHRHQRIHEAQSGLGGLRHLIRELPGGMVREHRLAAFDRSEAIGHSSATTPTSNTANVAASMRNRIARTQRATGQGSRLIDTLSASASMVSRGGSRGPTVSSAPSAKPVLSRARSDSSRPRRLPSR